LAKPVDVSRPPPNVPRRASISTAQRAGADWVGELMMVRCDGSTYPVEMTFSPIHGSNAEFIGAVAFQRDISARRKIHEAFQRRKTLSAASSTRSKPAFTRSTAAAPDPPERRLARMPHEHGWLKVTEQRRWGRSLLDYVPDPAPARGTGACVPNRPCRRRPQELQSSMRPGDTGS